MNLQFFLGCVMFVLGAMAMVFNAPRVPTVPAIESKHHEMLYHKAYDAMIEKRESLRDSNDVMLQEANADYENDLKTFSIAAVKSGTFLSITMVLGLRAALVAVNLANVRDIVVDSGAPPDQDGTLRWSFYYLTPHGMIPESFYEKAKDATDVETWVEYYWRDRKSSKRTMFSTAYYRGPIAPESFMYDVPDFKATRFAKSSVIRFVGTETELYVPFGKQNEALGAILTALELKEAFRD